MFSSERLYSPVFPLFLARYNDKTAITEAANMAQKTEKSFETHQGKKPNQKLKPCLGTPQNDLPRLQVHIPILNVSNSCSAAAAVQKKVHDHPCPILTKAAVPRWLLQEPLQLFIGVSLFHRFLFLHVGECQSRDPLRIAPI